MEKWHKSAGRHCADRERFLVRGTLSMAMSMVLLLTASLAAAQASPLQSRLASSDTVHMATVQGTVFDSVAHEPLAGAQVQLVDAATKLKFYSAVSDSLGYYRIDSIPSGQYIAGFFHPSLDLLGLDLPLRLVQVAAGAANTINLGIPGGKRMGLTFCGERSGKDSSGAMVGRVQSAGSKMPIASAKVVVSWLEILIQQDHLVSQPRQLIAKTDADGAYRVCGLPGSDTVFVNAEAVGTTSGTVNVAIPAYAIARQDFTVGDSASAVPLVIDSTASPERRAEATVLRGSAKLSGVVLGPNRVPLSEARVVVRGTGLEATSDAAGRFAISGLPSGTFSVDARAIGKEPIIVPVQLSNERPARIEILLTKPIQNLTRVLVFGKIPKRRQDLLDFERRKNNGMGHYFSADDIYLKHAVEITNVLTMVPGVRVISRSRFEHTLTMHGGCNAWVYLDGLKMDERLEDINDIPPNQLAGIEVYSGPLEAPPKFPAPIGCGIVLLWLKH